VRRVSAAFELLYRTNHRRLLATLTARGHPDPEDVAQEAWTRLWRQRHTIDETVGDPFYLLLTIAGRIVIDRHRRARLRPVSFYPAEEMAEEHAPEVGDNLDGFVDLLRLLPRSGDERSVLLLAYGFRMTEPMIALALGRSQGAVKMTRHRGLKRLRRAA
jgi:RNA polymerase sigma factor (sigma-70 family)